MGNIYLIIIIIISILAILDLVVGVSNDAVNFLNSAIGSKAAPRWIIMLVASIGIIAGATFSSGMMEVARKGIFNPDQFYFSEIMIIFLAVMITDIILLDTFNTFGLPTSTTVSIVFELLGSAVAVSIIKIHTKGTSILELGKYINSEKSFTIISGILLSIIIAFTLGAIIQYIVRLIFSFNYKKPLKYFGSIIGSLAITGITYFIFIKGIKGASFVTKQMLIFIKENTVLILLISFVGWAVLLQLLTWLVKINIPKFIILIGTFALAMAFAGNDLVNFIGVPLAALVSYKTYISHPGIDPNHLLMGALKGPVHTNTFILLIAGIIMIITLLLSRKARHVTETEINLGRQNPGDERFESTALSRLIVRRFTKFNNNFKRLIPKNIQEKIEKRFTQPSNNNDFSVNTQTSSSFDTIRASVNLTVATIIISFATSLKLPLSTTYVTFMVAMGTSLSDKAWGRDSAVYRITGVITVIAGWFFTAIIAFITSFLVAYIIDWGGIKAIFVLVSFAIFFIYRSQISFKKKEIEKITQKKEEESEFLYNTDLVLEKSNSTIISTLISISKTYYLTLEGLFTENRNQLKKINKEINELNAKAKKYKKTFYKTIQQLQENSIETGHYYVQVLDYLREIAHCLTFISTPIYEHVNNNHKPLIATQIAELSKINEKITSFLNFSIHIVKEEKYSELDEIIENQRILLSTINDYRLNQIKRIKKAEVNTRNSMLYLSILSETKNMLLYIVNLLKSQRDFVTYTKKVSKSY